MNSGEFDSLSSYDRMLRILGKRMDLVKTEETIDRFVVIIWSKRGRKGKLFTNSGR